MFYSRSTISIVGVFITCISIAVPIPASAQSLFDMMVSRALNDPTTLITLNEYGSFIQAASGPFSLPGVSSASFQVSRGTSLGDGEFSRLVLPISHSFESLEFGGITPYSEVTFSYTEQKQNEFWMEGTPMQMMVSHNIETASIMGGLGLDFEPVEGLIIRPIVQLGWSRIKDNSNPTTMMGQNFRAAVGDDLFIWEVDQLQYGPALEAEYITIVGSDIKVLADLRVTQLNVETIETNTPGLEESSKFHSVNGNFELDGPTSMSIYSRDVHWQYFMAAVHFDKTTSDALNFSWLGEIGAGLSLVDNQQDLPFVEALGMRGSVIFGDNDLSGWTIGVTAIF